MSTSWDYWAIRLLPFLFPVAVTLAVVFYNKAKPEHALWLGYTAFLILGLFTVALIHDRMYAETETSGLLRPASEPTPPHPVCGTVPEGAVALLYGDSVSYVTRFPHTVLRVVGEDLLSVNLKDGGIAVSAKIYSGDRKLVAEIIDNEFHINPTNYFRRERPDLHTLTVYDQQGQRALYVRYLNSTAITVLGAFHTARGLIRIEEKGVHVQGNVFSGACNINVTIAININ
ncbi:MAG: hypothetical protein CAF45_004230 [Nitrospira sp. CG24E]|nr:MAG: hypothetical protein CAF45_004230 [Nitrospira sp. CG24E]